MSNCELWLMSRDLLVDDFYFIFFSGFQFWLIINFKGIINECLVNKR